MPGVTAVTAMETTEPAVNNQNSGESKSEDIELQIPSAMRSRVTYLREESDSFTLESVRRLLEEDIGLDKYALDVHKSFVKKHLVQCLEDSGNDGASEKSQETERKDDGSPIKEVAKLSEEHEATKDAKEDKSTNVAEDMKDEGNKEAIMSDIRKALQKRSSYIKANSEKITMGLLRRLLEQDLKLEKHSLDSNPFKKFINKELDEVLQIPDSPKRSTDLEKKVKSTPSKKLASKKTIAPKRKLSKSVSAEKKAKHAETDSEKDSDAGDSEMPLKRTKETTTALYGKRVEHLKSVIKSCGIRIPPTTYMKAKQVPEDEREATLIKELEQILAKEGLSSDPSEKEVKKRKNISKELEGIDTSNIVSSSRRRSTTSFAHPPKPKMTEESESESEESENGEDNKEEEEEGNEKAEEGSQSEEESSNEDDGAEESE